MEKENKPSNDIQRAETFRVSELIGKSWDDIQYIINKNKKNGFIMQKIVDDADFKQYCQQQAEKFLNHQVALRSRDIDAASILWLYGDLTLEDIQQIQTRLEKKEYIASDKFRDLTTDKTLQIFAEHLEDIREEMEMPVKGFENIRMNKRQKLIDYLRFMEGGNKSKEMFEKGNWKYFQNEFDQFPKMRTPFIIELHNKSAEKNLNSDRFKMMNRILFYRFEDIHNGRWKLGDEEELAVLEKFAFDNSGYLDSTTILEDIKAAREKKAALIAEREEKKRLTSEKNAQQTITDNTEKPKDDKTTEKLTIEEKPFSKPIKVKAAPLIIDEDISFNTPINTQENKVESETIPVDKSSLRAENPPIGIKTPTSDVIVETKPQIKEDNKKQTAPMEKSEVSSTEKVSDLAKTDIKTVSTPDAKAENEEEKEPENWQNNTFSEWKNWGRANRKWVQTYHDEKNDKGLSLKIYANRTAAEKDNFEADIHYRKHNHLVVKGKPGNDVFDGIIAAAKLNSNQICFGTIKSDEFKARLMLACLCDPEIEMVNAPKIEELKNIPEDLLEALKNPAIRKAEKAKGKKEMLERQKKYNDGRKSYTNDNGRPRREYTEEEKKAYRERKNRENGFASR